MATIHKVSWIELGSGGIAEALGSGAWLSVPNPFNVTGIYEDARDWIDNLLVTSYINKALKDNDAYIIFLPYGNISYYGTKERHNFTQDECANHWANDPSWPYFATCDVSLGAGGKEGMAVVVRPTASGWGSRSWTSEVEWQWASYTGDAHAMMESSIYGYAEHGYDYNLTSVNFQDILSKGSQEAKEQWKTMPLSTPGLFNLPLCEIPNLAFVTGGEQVQLDVSLCPGASPSFLQLAAVADMWPSVRWVLTWVGICQISGAASTAIKQVPGDCKCLLIMCRQR